MEPLKEQLNIKNALIIANVIKNHYKKFDIKSYSNIICNEIPKLELKQRVNILARELSRLLPQDYKICFSILIKASKELKGFKSLPLTEVVTFRMNSAPIFDALETLFELTPCFSSEFAMRPFLHLHSVNSLEYIKTKVNSSCEHERRLVSESTRPILPWGMQLPHLKNDPNLTWPLLKILIHDPSEYVQKSVANHLNDHSKNHPEWILKKLKFLSTGKFKNIKSYQKILKHALRTLIKKGNPTALEYLGVKQNTFVIEKFNLNTKQIKLGEKIVTEIVIKSRSQMKQKMVIDHILYLLRSNGKYNEKVFKGKVSELLPNETKKFKLSLTLKKVTTRNYYEGKQLYNLRVNGVDTNQLSFKII